MICKNCGLEIKPILDPWGLPSYQGKRYGYYHVTATENSDGKYITACPTEACDGEEAEPEVPRCEAKETVKLPYDSSPETITLQCLLPEDHGDDHEFEVA